MIKEFFDYIRKSVSGLAQPQRWFKDAMGVTPTAAGVDVTPEGSLACSTVAACTRLLSESIASLPLHVYQRVDTSRQKSPDAPLYYLLHDQPNEYQTSFLWRQQMVAHVLLHGNAYSVIDRDSSGRITALWPLLPECVVVKVQDGDISYEYFVNTERRNYRFDQILHVKGPSLNGVTGLSVISMAKQGIGLALAQDAHGASTFRNRARPGIVLKAPVYLKPEQRETYQTEFEQKFAGALNAGRTMLIEGGWDVSSVGFSNEDAQFLQSRQFSVQEICRWFRCPPSLVADLSRSTYSNSEQEMLNFQQNTLRPLCANVESELNVKLMSRSKFEAEFDLNGLARGDMASRYEAYSKGIAAGFLTVADIREAEGLPYIAGTDALLRAANMLLPQGGSNGIDQPAN